MHCPANGLTGQRLAFRLQTRIGHGRRKLAMAMPAGSPAKLLAIPEKHEDRDAMQPEAPAKVGMRVDIGMQPVQVQRADRLRIRSYV
ncbi:hypothetical protein LMG23994_05393 [Cupriavidus pinatubonensis]|uniref:Uncharacterized protein n=1 Tax=Cupriavidus pinatubonensis TaxID=248026 RepID=A0ABN7ZK24_9BURK|nr:hypothetical protein LMG23994_05393 [Cupriavidus pinatubonensis]